MRGVGLVACLVAREGSVLEAAALRVAAARLLPSHAVPDRFVVLDAIPLLPTQKMDRQALRAASALRVD